MIRLSSAAVVAGLFVLAVAAPASGHGREKLVVRSHGERMQAPLEWSDWCPEGGNFCMHSILDYAYEPNPRRLPFHRGSLIRMRTGERARHVTVTFSRKGRNRRIDAERDGRRWTLRAPGDVYSKQYIGILADYRYRKDGKVYGGRYSFFLPVRKHVHAD